MKSFETSSNKPLISVVMAVYNGEKYLKESIKSILNQTYKKFEFIIVNDGSTDKSKAILEKFAENDKRIKIVHQENMGLAYSLNIGIKLAKGEFIARMDDDDISHPYRLETQCKVLIDNSNIGVCHSYFSLINSNGKKIPFRKNTGFNFSSLQTKWTLLWRNCICHPSVMIRHNILKEFNILYDDKVICQDYELWCRLIDRTDFFIIKKSLLSLRKHYNNVSSNYDEKYLSKFSDIISRNLGKYIETPLDYFELRAITLISGQMYLRGKDITGTIDANKILQLISLVFSEYIKKNSCNKKNILELHNAVAHQLIRWCQQSWYNNKKASIKFLKAAFYHYLSMLVYKI
ncbi:MAG: glycosyltransferase [Desulfobacterales bacterium]|nr:glycosyltransferase [Desulfobacterales bacterium]